MLPSSRRLAVLLFGSSIGAVGWGAVLPFLYADLATARGLGAAAAAVTFTAFAVGALVAAPVAGRLADDADPVVVGTAARFAMAAAIAALAYGRSPLLLCLAAAGYGAALSVMQPATSVLLLEATPTSRRRDAFAWQFIGQNLALALGGFVGGRLVDLTSPTGARPAYAFAAVAAVLSAVVVAVAARGHAARVSTPPEPVEDVGYRAVLRVPAVRWLLVVTVLLTLACYAQFDSGLPAYALNVLSVRPSTLGVAVALNAVMVAALTGPVVRMTRSRPAAALLATCGVLWVGVWLVLGLPLLHREWGSTLVVAGYALFSVGETMLAPVLSPLAGQLAPQGAAGRTLGAITGAQTLATAVGPGLSGALLGLGAPAGFVALQLLCCSGAIVGARRLFHAMHRPKPQLLQIANVG